MQQVSLMEELADLSQPHHHNHHHLTHHQQQHDDDGSTPAAAAASGAAGAAGGAAGGGAGSSGSNDDGDVLGVRAVTWQEMLPVLGDNQVEQLMGRIGQVTEVGLAGWVGGVDGWKTHTRQRLHHTAVATSVWAVFQLLQKLVERREALNAALSLQH